MPRSCATSVGPRQNRRTVRRPARPANRGFVRSLGAPLILWGLIGSMVFLAACATANWLYQTYRKPSELLFPADGVLAKTPSQTWQAYGPLFREYSTAVITSDLLAALAQVEGSGNPAARTYWRWQVSANPFELYRPASSAVGMFQITDATFREARRYCIHDHVVVEDGAWHDMGSCWFNSLYTRVVPSHAIQLTAALLDRKVAGALPARRPVATLQQKQRLAAVIHLCGAGAGNAYARRGFRVTSAQRCGDHDLKTYLAKVESMKRQFAKLAASG